MIGSRAAIRYAKAVLQQAGDSSQAKAVFADMETVKTTIDGNRELRSVLKSPVVKTEDKQAILLDVFNGQSADTKALITLLSENKRTSLLASVADSYMKLYNEALDIKVAHVTTAVPLSDELEKQVLAKVESITGSKSVTLENHIDESIIGGFILRIGDLQYNASISNQFGNLKREFSKSL